MSQKQFSRLHHYWNIFWLYRRFELMRMLAHRGDTFFWASISIMWTAFNYFFFGLITNISGSIGSWTPNDMTMLMSVFTILDAFTWSFFYQSMKDYTHFVFSGELSMLLMQPLSPIFALTSRRNSYNNLPRVIIGILGVIYAASHLAQPPSLGMVILFIVTIITALIMIYALWFFLATFSFWVERLDNINDVIPSIRRIWQLPREVYRGALAIAFTIIIPIGLASSVPAEVISGRHAWEWVAYFILFTVLLCVGTYYFFQFSLRRYSSIGG